MVTRLLVIGMGVYAGLILTALVRDAAVKLLAIERAWSRYPTCSS
jgi:hypothetical protein